MKTAAKIAAIIEQEHAAKMYASASLFRKMECPTSAIVAQRYAASSSHSARVLLGIEEGPVIRQAGSLPQVW